MRLSGLRLALHFDRTVNHCAVLNDQTPRDHVAFDVSGRANFHSLVAEQATLDVAADGNFARLNSGGAPAGRADRNSGARDAIFPCTSPSM